MVRVPILVGITGKRELDARMAKSVKQRIAAVFDRLDAQFPHVPKVLLTGAAYGVDSIAADLLTSAATHGPAHYPDWSVVVLLPFAQDLFEQDFPTAQPLEALRTLLAFPERVLVRVLPPLKTADGAATHAQLDKLGPHGNRVLRRMHYEQVGQLIAESATILLAVMAGGDIADSTAANGGTARVVACRRAGRPDERGMEVACRSTVLRCEWGALVNPPSYFVWLIEPDRVAKIDGYPVVVLGPIDETKHENAYLDPALPQRPSRMGRWARHQARQLQASLIIPRAFERLHQGDAQGDHAPALPPRLEMARLASPADAIPPIRQVLSRLQGDAKVKAERTFKAIAALFVLAVLSLEIFSKIITEPYMLLIYLGFFGATFGVIILARRRRWQPLSEDYRAVNEMLRVQRAWWSAGLMQRIDRLHLQSVDAELSRIRDAVRTILAWIWLRAEWPADANPPVDWAQVRGTAPHPRSKESLRAQKIPADWIGSQIFYYARSSQLYDRLVRRFDAITWSLFAASAWLAVMLCFWQQWPDLRDWIDARAAAARILPQNLADAACSLVIWAALGGGVIMLWSRLASHRAARRPSRLAVPLAVLVGLLAAMLFSLAIESGVITLRGVWHLEADMIAERLTVILFVTLSAIAGATRYVSEKLNFAAQAAEYHDALERFERAEGLLAPGADPTSGAPADQDVARRIVRDLALLALRENEAWLKARRERPLSPIVG